MDEALTTARDPQTALQLRTEYARAMSVRDIRQLHARRYLNHIARAFAADRGRFLENWPAGSALRRLLDQRLPKL